ncbi:MAG: hypothetical protein VCA36_05120 [Opitutales bacterium]
MNCSTRPVIFLVVLHLFGSCGGSGLPEVPDDAKGTAEAIIHDLAENKPGILWSAMPTSYQTDINELARSAIATIDKDIYDKVAGLLRKANKILKEKKSYILKSDQVGLMAKDLDEVSRNWDMITELVDILLDSQLGAFETAKKFDGGEFLANTGTDLMEKVVAISALTPEDKWMNEILPTLKAITVKEVSSSEKKTVLEFIDADGQKETHNFVKVEGKWIPENMQIKWAKGIENAKAEISNESTSLEAKMGALMFIGLAEGILNQLDDAESEEEFLKVLEGLSNFGALGG